MISLLCAVVDIVVVEEEDDRSGLGFAADEEEEGFIVSVESVEEDLDAARRGGGRGGRVEQCVDMPRECSRI